MNFPKYILLEDQDTPLVTKVAVPLFQSARHSYCPLSVEFRVPGPEIVKLVASTPGIWVNVQRDCFSKSGELSGALRVRRTVMLKDRFVSVVLALAEAFTYKND